MDAVRRGYWCFYFPEKNAATATQTDNPTLGTTIEVCGYRLGLAEEGFFEPVNLLKNRSSAQIPANTPSSSSSSGSALDASTRALQPSHAHSTNSLANGTGPPDAESRAGSTSGSEAKGHGTVPVAEMHEFFINAVLSSLSISFCRLTGSIYLTPRTVLLPPSTPWLGNSDVDKAAAHSALANFRIYLTTTGSLVISLSVALVEGLVSIADDAYSNSIPAGTSVLAAPLGAFASSQAPLDKDIPDHLSAQSPDSRVGRLRPDVTDRLSRWRGNLSKLLQMRGMSPSLLDGCSWLKIQSLRPSPYDNRVDDKKSPQGGPASIVSWPSALCFRKLAVGSLYRQGPDSTLFPVTTPITAHSFDPLDAAKSWYGATSEREEVFSRRRKEREDVAAREAAEFDTRNQQPSSASPLVLGRTNNGVAAVAAGTMYPTPPGGAQPPGVTPSFDGAVSSPANAANGAATDVDITMTTDQPPPVSNTFPDSWDESADVKREQSTSFLEADNLYGDLGEDMFENNELTDADFNFFDEDPAQTGLDLSGLPDIETTMDMSDFTQPGQGSIPGEENQPPSVRPASPKFAKPELRHARSILGEESRQQANLDSFRANASLPAGIKRQPSPFDPDTVYKRVRASFRGPPRTVLPLTSSTTLPRRNSVFERVDFDPSLSLANKKYQEKGQFNYSLPSLKRREGDEEDEPRSASSYNGLMKTQRSNLKTLPSNIGTLIARITGGLEGSSLQRSPTKRDDQSSDADDLSLVSDQGDSSDDADEPSSPAKSSVVRKRPEDDNLSLAASFSEMDPSIAESPAYAAGELPGLSGPGTPELPVAKYFADPEPSPFPIICPDSDFITIAQILTEQAVTGSLRLNPRDSTKSPSEARRSVSSATRHSIRCLRSALPFSLGQATSCHFRQFLDLKDVPLLAQPTRPQHRPSGHEIIPPTLYQIPAPHVELRRYESHLSVLPSATAFWESLGLGPSQGTKDINAMCVSPKWEGMEDNAGAFLDRIRSVYESLKLGTFERIPSPTEEGVDGFTGYSVGQEPLDASPAGPQRDSELSDVMSTLAQVLASLTVTKKNFVVYFVYHPGNANMIVDSCSAFQELFEKYKTAMEEEKKEITNELVLQLVPLDAIASEDSLAILPPAEYAKLCLETYDRCTLFDGLMPAPAIVLEQALPRMIDFKLTTTPSASLLHENSCIHIAYAQSVDERWITAAWTDNRGSKQMTASYCLGRRSKQLTTPLANVLHEIWETTHDVIGVWKVHWRVIVTKCGPIGPTEVDYWTTLAQTERNASVNLTLLTVDTDPSLQLVPPAVRLPAATPSAFYTTPVSTPQPSSIVSPEQSGNPPTPMGAAAATPSSDPSATVDPEADATLVDMTDATWGAVVSHRLNNSNSLTDLNPALTSGYLVKRGGTKTEDPPVVMEVNIIHSDGNLHPRTYEGLLREMLSYFRALGTLARLRGVVDRETDIRPWHVAAAEKGVRTLYQLL